MSKQCNSQNETEEYKSINCEIRKMMRDAKESWASEQCGKIEESLGRGLNRDAFLCAILNFEHSLLPSQSGQYPGE